MSRPDNEERRGAEGMGGAEPPGATRSAHSAQAWRGRRAPDLPWSEHHAGQSEATDPSALSRPKDQNFFGWGHVSGGVIVGLMLTFDTPATAFWTILAPGNLCNRSALDFSSIDCLRQSIWMRMRNRLFANEPTSCGKARAGLKAAP